MKIDQFLAGVIQCSTQHTCFYHFTDQRNVTFIKAQGGLLPMRILRDREIDVPAPGGNQWSLDADHRCGMDAYVHLCFMADHGMEYLARTDGRIKQTAWLRIDPSVLRMPGVLVTADVSNKSGVAAVPAEVALESLDLEVIYKRLDWRISEVRTRLRAAKKYEILVPGLVPLNLIKFPNG